jgi:hypothetical protein
MRWNNEPNRYLPRDASKLSAGRRQVIDGEQRRANLGISRVRLDGSCGTGHHQTRPGIGEYRWSRSILEGASGYDFSTRARSGFSYCSRSRGASGM